MFSQFDLRNFDVVIVSATGAYNPNMIQTLRLRSGHAKKTLHVCYCHTPPRYLYGYATAREWKRNFLSRVLGEIANHFLRLIDFRNSQNVDFFIANSKNVSERITKFYRRDSVVIYPPVDTASGSSASSVELKNNKLDASLLDARGYFVAGGRIARPKHIDLIVRACRELNVVLKVFGRGFAGYEYELKTQNPKLKNTTQSSKVEFVGEVTDEEKAKLMRNAKAFIFAGEDEDFGITPVEAMSVGTPVIAYRSGGIIESVIEGRTGIFFDKLSIDSLRDAIKRLNDLNH